MPANYVLLEKITVGAAGASSVTFSSIPQTGYTDLVVKASARTSRAAVEDGMGLYFNADTSNYTWRTLFGNGSSASSVTQTSGYGTVWISRVDGANATANTFASVDVYIPNYTSSNYKSYNVDGVTENNATEAYANITAPLFSSTAAITSITLVGGNAPFIQGSTFYLYGVAKFGTTPAIQPYATGGDTIMTDGTYWYHAFRSSGTFTPAKGLSCDVLVVAGGGGGSAAGGGGGAGGVFYSSGNSVATAQTVTIGAGGTGGFEGKGTNGNNSVFGALTAAVGGGTGGSDYLSGTNENGVAGGSGGGGGQNPGSGLGIGGTATSGQGNAGGTGSAAGGSYGGGAGGGAGAVGGNGSGSAAGVGGAGTASYSSWGSVTGTGQNVSGTYYFAGGGGGGANTGSGGQGGAGGGGAGGIGTVQPGTAGTANTGGGGGASSGGASGGQGGAGGSGIVIVRYAV